MSREPTISALLHLFSIALFGLINPKLILCFFSALTACKENLDFD